MRLELVKMEDEGSGRKPQISSFESFGKGEERNRVRRSSGLSSRTEFNRIDEVIEMEVGSRATRKCSILPVKSSS